MRFHIKTMAERMGFLSTHYPSHKQGTLVHSIRHDKQLLGLEHRVNIRKDVAHLCPSAIEIDSFGKHGERILLLS